MTARRTLAALLLGSLVSVLPASMKAHVPFVLKLLRHRHELASMALRLVSARSLVVTGDLGTASLVARSVGRQIAGSPLYSGLVSKLYWQMMVGLDPHSSTVATMVWDGVREVLDAPPEESAQH